MTRKLIVSEFLTLDGVMQAPGDVDEDREGGFKHGGWQDGLFDEVLGDAIGEIFSETDALLLGRKTYELFADFWPNGRRRAVRRDDERAAEVRRVDDADGAAGMAELDGC